MNLRQATRIGSFPRTTLLLGFIALTLLIFGARLCYYAEFGSALPFWDQWDGEGWNLYRPMLLGTLDFHGFIAPHNEHRIVMSRLLASILFLANNEQWDVVPLIIANGLLAGAIYAGFALYLLRQASPFGLPLAALTALCALLGHGWENFLQGFQTAFFALLGAALVGIVWAAHARMRWQQMAVCGLLSLVAIFSLGSGFLLPPILGLVLLLRWRDEDAAGRRWLVATLIVLAALTVLGLALRAGGSPTRPPLGAVLSALTTLLSWPFPNLSVLSPLLWSFTAIGLWRVASGADRRACSLAMGGIACWVLLQILAMALVRAELLASVPSRYTDLLGFGVIANAYFAFDFFVGREARAPGLRFCRRISVIAGICLIAALGLRTGIDLQMMRQRSVEFAEQRTNVSAYLVTGNPAYIMDKPVFHIPYPSAERFKEFLDDPTIRRMLHRHVFATPAQPLSAALLEDPQIGPVSYAGRILLGARELIVAIAAFALLLAGAAQTWSRRDELATGPRAQAVPGVAD